MDDKAMFSEGQAIGPYRIVRCIGCGGMGEVYEVEHESLGVHYALKTFAYRGGKPWPMLRAKFMEEGQVLSRLRHPNLVRVFDLSIDGASGVAYYVMDLVLYKDGNPYTLADVVRSSASEDDMYMWFRDLCNALDYIHSKGVVNRDVKLDNILLNADRHVLLADFGIAHIFGDGMVKASAGACATGAFSADGRWMVLGTDRYMSPEVADGAEPTPAADAYALGVVMFKLLTGAWYEPGTDVRAMLAGHEWKYRWADVLHEMLAEGSKDRPQVLAQAVIGLQGRKEMPLPERTVMRQRRWVWFAIVCACVVLLAGGGLLAWRFWEESSRRELADRRAEEKRQKELELRRKAAEEALASLKVEDAPHETEDGAKDVAASSKEPPKSRAEVTPVRPAPKDVMCEPSMEAADTIAKKAENGARHSSRAEAPAKEYRWLDGSGKAQEVLFDVGGSETRLLPFRADGAVFWMCRLPVSVTVWRTVKGGCEGLEAIEAALPAETPLCVLAERAEAEAFCRAMSERFHASLPDGYEVRLAMENEMRAALAEDETAKLCEATGRNADDCVGWAGAVARARFRRVKEDCRLDRFGKWAEDGRLMGKKVVVGGLPMPRASGVVGLSSEWTKASPLHFVVGRILSK